MRNKVGGVAEERIRTLIVDWLSERDLILEQKKLITKVSSKCTLRKNIIMRFGSERIYHYLKMMLLAVVEIKGGIDTAER